MEEVIRLLNKHRIRYLLIGGQAMRLEGMPRFSMDWDLFIPGKDAENIQRINDLLADELDLPLVVIGRKGENVVQTYQTRWGIVQFHLAVPGLASFDDAEGRMVVRKDERGTRIHCVCGKDLLKLKKAAGRPQDQQDILFLEKKKELGLL